eukprot:GHVT01019002.1.p1 GENE.GHVT01019002.1~~GHVT01019002.1.p1  ORF type:complete len:106 (+),score=5.61 GHVT01019002.1:1234-1551(+)
MTIVKNHLFMKYVLALFILIESPPPTCTTPRRRQVSLTLKLWCLSCCSSARQDDDVLHDDDNDNMRHTSFCKLNVELQIFTRPSSAQKLLCKATLFHLGRMSLRS